MTTADTYIAIRDFTDTWGLVITVVSFVALAAWPLRPGSARANDAAARMIFEDDGHD